MSVSAPTDLEYITELGVHVRVDDLVEVSLGDERVAGRILLYNGRLWVGRSGGSVRAYEAKGWSITVLDRAELKKRWRVRFVDPNLMAEVITADHYRASDRFVEFQDSAGGHVANFAVSSILGIQKLSADD